MDQKSIFLFEANQEHMKNPSLLIIIQNISFVSMVNSEVYFVEKRY